MRSVSDKRRKRRQRGSITIVTALGMTTLLGAAALAIDLGHVFNVKTESQRIADLAALAGAGAFVQSPGFGVATTARVLAIDYASRNTVNQATTTLLPTDVDVNPSIELVDVRVQNTSARGTAIPSVFANVLGVGQLDVVTAATAQAYPASGVQCALPVFAVDQWDERGGNPTRFDPGTDYYEAYDPAAPTSTYTGYDKSDIGTSLTLTAVSGPPGPPGQPDLSWYYPFDAGSIPSGAGYSSSIVGCPAPDYVTSRAHNIAVAPGATVTTTALGFAALIALDPAAAWDPSLLCVMDGVNVGSGNGAHCRSSPRWRPLPFLAPPAAPAAGTQQVGVVNLGGVFIEEVIGTQIQVRITGYNGVNPIGSPGAGVTPPLLKVVRLVG